MSSSNHWWQKLGPPRPNVLTQNWRITGPLSAVGLAIWALCAIWWILMNKFIHSVEVLLGFVLISVWFVNYVDRDHFLSWTTQTEFTDSIKVGQMSGIQGFDNADAENARDNFWPESTNLCWGHSYLDDEYILTFSDNFSVDRIVTISALDLAAGNSWPWLRRFGLDVSLSFALFVLLLGTYLSETEHENVNAKMKTSPAVKNRADTTVTR